MKVFVTGGTGYIGGATVAALRRAGHDVTALVRSVEKGAAVEALGARAHVGFLAEPETYAEAARAADAIVHAAAEMSAGMAEIDRTAVETLADAAARGGRRLVYTSGVWVAGDTGGRLIDEDAPLAPPPVVAWRPAVEHLALGAARHGVAACVIRPGIVYGGKGGLVGGLILGEPGAVKIVGDGSNCWAPVYVDDLADLYVRAVEHGLSGHALYATDGSRVSVREIADALAQASGREVTVWPLDEARKALQGVADALCMSQAVSSARATALLGWRPRHGSIVAEAGAIVRAALAK